MKIEKQEGIRNRMAGAATSQKMALLLAAALVCCLPEVVLAATTGAEFQGLYDFVFDAATGYLGRAIAIVGGLVGLGVGAASGKPVIAIVGVVLAVFGALGPAIVNSVFGSAII